MQITNTSAALRPRSVWEANDLGFVLAREWLWPLMRLWLGVALPVFIICAALSYDSPKLTLFLFWWLKPAYEQLPLIFLSRALFNQQTDIKIYSWSSFKIIFKQLFWNITFRRLSGIRSFTAAVAQLEGLSGRNRQNRLDSLTRSAPGIWGFTLILFSFELLIQSGILLMLLFITPDVIDLKIWADEHELLILHASNVAYFIAAGMIAPFYVSAGFALYINRRTKLEGWDIEIEFRKLQDRLSRNTRNAALWIPALILLPLLSFATPQIAHAEYDAIIDKAEAKKLIEKVLAKEDFGEKRMEKRWKRKEKPEKEQEEKDQDFDFGAAGVFKNLAILLSQIGEVLLWTAIAAVVVFLLYKLPQWLERLPKPGGRKRKSDREKPSVLFGLNVEQGSLPQDISAAALELLRQGEFRLCMSLLYRASLSLLINQHGLDVHSSHTEGECLRLVESMNKNEISHYFGELTQVWVALAYGHQSPSEPTLLALCQNWAGTFENQE